MEATNVLDTPLGYIPSLWSILLIKTHKTQLQTLFKVKVLKDILGHKKTLTCFAALGSANESVKNIVVQHVQEVTRMADGIFPPWWQ